jgi:hypothetical protein
MAMKAVPLLVWATLLALPSNARAQGVQLEVDFTGGYSTDDVSAGAVQIRVFGEMPKGLRIYSEAAWAGRRMYEGRDEGGTDAFGVAYPYRNRMQAIEVYAERLFQPGGALVGVRAGRYRTPFGIYDLSDYAYSGFLRAPLIRYDGYFALSNNFLEHGAELIAGVPALYVTTSLSRPADVGSAQRRDGLDSVSRLQGYYGPLIVGASLIRTNPYFPERFARGRSVFTGVDFRFHRGGVEVVGEWITGRPFEGTSTDGWHASIIVHRREMGPVTAVARVEALTYDAAPPRAASARRQTIGARIVLFRRVTAQISALHQTGNLSDHANALDAAITYSVRLR